MMMVMLTTMAANAYWTLIIHRHCSKWFTHINPLDLNNFMLLLLSRFSRVRLCVTPEMAAHQAPPSLGFSRQEHWTGLPFPSPMHESEKWKWRHSVVSDSVQPHRWQPTRLPHLWDFPDKSTGVGCHCLLQPHLKFQYIILDKKHKWIDFIETVIPHQLEGDAGKQSKLITCQYLSDTIWRLQVLSLSVMSNSSWPNGLPPTRLLHPWYFPGKSTGVGCHCLLWRSH